MDTYITEIYDKVFGTTSRVVNFDEGLQNEELFDAHVIKST